MRLIEHADVLVEGNRPGVMDRLGLGWNAIHKRNPKLVMCSISGYGQDGPFASRAGHDLNYMATAGGLGVNANRAGPPVPLSVQVADVGAGGLQPAVAILGALVGVQRGGEGRLLDASMTDGAVTWLALELAATGAGVGAGGGGRGGGRGRSARRLHDCRSRDLAGVGAGGDGCGRSRGSRRSAADWTLRVLQGLRMQGRRLLQSLCAGTAGTGLLIPGHW